MRIRLCEYCQTVEKRVEFKTNHSLYLCQFCDEKLTKRNDEGLSDLDKAVITMNDRFTREHDKE